MSPLSFAKKSSESIKVEFIKILKELEDKDPDIEGSVIIRSDGLILASALPADIDSNLAAAMSASIFSVSQRVLKELNRGSIINTIVRGEDGVLMIISVTEDIVLAAIGKRDSNLGLMLVEMQRTAEKIKEILKKI